MIKVSLKSGISTKSTSFILDFLSYISDSGSELILQHISSKEILIPLVVLIKSNDDVENNVRSKILYLIQKLSLTNNESLKAINETYKSLADSGIKFPTEKWLFYNKALTTAHI